MIVINIRLIGEQNDRLFNGIELNEQIQYTELKNLIQWETNLPANFQAIKFRGKRLPVVRRPFASIHDIQYGEELVVKHCHFDAWEAYLSNYEKVNDPEYRRIRTILADHAIAHSKNLQKSGFFEAYVSLVEEWETTLGQLLRIANKTRDAIEQSATKFFSNMYPDCTIDFKPKPDGTREGLVATITCNEEVINYFIKTYHQAGESDILLTTAQRYLPDLREMFAYRLLEHIGMGPIVFFPFYAGSTQIHYIATKEINEFKKLYTLENVNEQNKVVVEAYLLSLILGLRGFNEGNVGLTGENTLSIVDFFVPELDKFTRSGIFFEFKDDNLFGIGVARDILTKVQQEERIRIAEDALPRWSRINNVTSDIIGNEKRELRENGLKIGRATEDVESYLLDIKKNYSAICSAIQ